MYKRMGYFFKHTASFRLQPSGTPILLYTQASYTQPMYSGLCIDRLLESRDLLMFILICICITDLFSFVLADSFIVLADLSRGNVLLLYIISL
jgi:hypothetical protein